MDTSPATPDPPSVCPVCGRTDLGCRSLPGRSHRLCIGTAVQTGWVFISALPTGGKVFRPSLPQETTSATTAPTPIPEHTPLPTSAPDPPESLPEGQEGIEDTEPTFASQPTIPTEDRPIRAGKGSGRTGKTGRSPARELAASLLATGEKIKDAAKAARIGERTLRRWLDEDAVFAEMVARLRGEIITSATGQLIGNMSAGTAVLRELLDSENEAIRYKSATKLVELALRATDAIEVEQRLKALELKMRNES